MSAENSHAPVAPRRGKRHKGIIITQQEADAMHARRIPGFADYAITRDGVVISYRQPKPRTIVGHKQKGYIQITLHCDLGGTRNVGAHRLVALAYLGPPGKRSALHINGVRDDNRLENLYWGTHSDNARDAVRHGTHNAGERHHSRRNPELVLRGSSHPMARLDESDVVTIRERLKRGDATEAIACAYGITRSSVNAIRARKIWKHVA